jgi:hypothetical protein
MAYANGKIYALRTHHSDECYIGSTIRTLKERLALHKCDLTTTAKSLFEKYNDVYIELIELFPCETKAQLNRREGEIMRGFGDKIVNKCIAGRTKHDSNKAYREANKEKIKQSNKAYREANKEKAMEQQRIRRAKAKNNLTPV